MLYAQSAKAVAGFFGQHGRAVVGQKGPWQSAFHEGLGQAMDQALGRFGQVKLQMAAQPAVVVADGKGHGPMPFTRGIQDADFGLVKVQMPQAMDMGHFKAAHLPALEPVGGPLLSAAGLCRL
jgi:hypothetical protein